MSDQEMKIKAIGKVKSAYDKHDGTPIQANYETSNEASLLIDPEYREGLEGLAGFDRIYVICWLDRSKPYKLSVIPYLDDEAHGLFTTRAPSRPNPIGLSLVKILSVDVKEGIIRIEGIDILDNTPILDIKPYIPDFDVFPDSKSGWYEKAKGKRLKADNRFSK